MPGVKKFILKSSPLLKINCNPLVTPQRSLIFPFAHFFTQNEIVNVLSLPVLLNVFVNLGLSASLYLRELVTS